MIRRMEKSCERCGKPYNRPPALAGRFCSKQCAYAARRKERPKYRRQRYLPDHPLAGATGLVSDARVVLYARVGPGWHACHWCGAKVRWLINRRGNARGALIADHLDGDPLNDSPDNVVVSCGGCNGTRGRVIQAGELFVANGAARTRAVERVCARCHRPFLVGVAQARTPGKGLYCSRSCARRRAS